MKYRNKTIIALLSVIYICNTLQAETIETAYYRLRYGVLKAGTATITTQKVHYQGQQAFHTVVDARTTGFVDQLYSVHDIFESTYDSKFMPFSAVRNVHEGRSYTQREDVTFKPENKQVTSSLVGTQAMSDGTRDIISAMFALRRVNFDKLQPNTTLVYTVFHERKEFPIHVRYKGVETIKIDKTEYRCYRVAPMVDPGELFQQKEGLTMWISADDQRRIMYAKMNFKVGSFKLEWRDTPE